LLDRLRSPLVLRSGIALVDQALLSALSFGVSILLIRTVPKIEYGYYSIAVTASLFLISLQSALINSPLTVLLAAKEGPQRRRYLGNLYRGQLLVILPSALLGLLTIALLRRWGLEPMHAAVAAAVCVAAVGSLLREFTVSYLFAEELPGRALSTDALYAVLFLVSASAACVVFGVTVPSIILLLGTSALVVALWRAREFAGRWQWGAIGSSVRENWHLGRWALVGVIVTHVQSYSYMYLVGGLVGGSAVAELSAARLLLSPLTLLQTGWMKIAIPHGSRLREEGAERLFFRQLVIGSVNLAVLGAIYVVVLVACAGFLLRIVLSEKYASSFAYLPMWGVILILMAAELSASYGLQVMKRFRALATVDAIGMVVTVSSALVLVHGFGVRGALLALAIGEGFLTVLLWWCLWRTVFNSSPAGRESRPRRPSLAG
jgi:O-antigen/teichoic acid export membrane protein